MPVAAMFSLTLVFLMLSVAVRAQEAATIARLVVWQPKPAMARDFAEGYKRHLQWHRRSHDPWTWHGWTVISGDRYGYFVDGTFFRTWAELDSAVSPAEDAADNDVNVVPYGDVRAVATYETISPVKDLSAQQFSSTLMTFGRFEVAPGRDAEFESLILAESSRAAASTIDHAVLRPVNGATDYLLLLTARKPSELAMHAQFMTRLLRALRSAKGDPLLVRFHTETARYRPDMSYVPDD